MGAFHVPTKNRLMLLPVGSCSQPAVGYDPGPLLVLVTGQQALVQIAFKALTYFLILHPIVYANPPSTNGAPLTDVLFFLRPTY